MSANDCDCLFCGIAGHTTPADIVYEDGDAVAFRDINPKAPIHVLIIPKRHIGSIAEVSEGDAALMGRLVVIAARLARELGVLEGFRLVANSGRLAGQSVPHVHLHLLGGRPLGWPPG